MTEGEEGPGSSPFADRLTAITSLLEERGLLSPDEIRRAVEDMDGRTPALGAQVVARAWSDSRFKRGLLRNADEALGALGFDNEGFPPVVALENTSQVHNLVVCTLCSCYPRSLLGYPPSWYKSLEYRSRAVVNPRGVLREFGVELDPEVTVRVHDSTADIRYLVIPERPQGTVGLTEDELAALVTRDSLVGATRVQPPEG